MKNNERLIGAIIGLVIGVVIGFISDHTFSSRYSLLRVDDASVLRIDTFTGKTWICIGSKWFEVFEAQPGERPKNSN